MCCNGYLWQKIKTLVLIENVFKAFEEIREGVHKFLWHRKRSLGRSRLNYLLQHCNFFGGFFIFYLAVPIRIETWVNSQSIFTHHDLWEIQPYFVKSVIIIAIAVYLLGKIAYKPKVLFDADTKKSLQIMGSYVIVSVIAFWDSCTILSKKIVHRIHNLFFQWSH